MRKILIFGVAFLFIFSTRTGYAQSDHSLREVVVDALYGGLAGTLIGVATLAFADQPSDHTENIQVGAGVGIILGSLYGTLRVSQSLVEWQNGVATMQLPVISWSPTASRDQHVSGRINVSILSISY